MIDTEFHEAVEKTTLNGAFAPREVGTSPLAIASLTLGILAWIALFGVGAIAAIVAGHIALGRIRESGGRLGGRGMARVGMVLGYLQVAVGLLALAGILLLMAFRMRVTPASTEQATIVSTPAAPQPPSLSMEQGVKMANEIGSSAMAVARQAVPQLAEGEEILCLYNAGERYSPAEFAILTDKTLAYVKEDRVTSFPLKDVQDVTDDAEYNRKYHSSYVDSSRFVIEVRNKKGSRMRISVKPSADGPLFYRAILDSWANENPGAAKAIEAKTKAN